MGSEMCIRDRDKFIQQTFQSPLISNQDKKKLVESSLKGNVPEVVKSFISVLANNNRFSSLPGISDSFQRMINDSTGMMVGNVRSATPLSDPEKANLKTIIEKELSTKVELNYQVEQSMIGGLEAKVGSYIFEDSMKSHIQKLNDHITRSV